MTIIVARPYGKLLGTEATEMILSIYLFSYFLPVAIDLVLNFFKKSTGIFDVVFFFFVRCDAMHLFYKLTIKYRIEIRLNRTC